MKLPPRRYNSAQLRAIREFITTNKFIRKSKGP
jgi:hypothetical protein